MTKRRVLIVDGDPQLRSTMARQMGAAGLHALEASDIGAALANGWSADAAVVDFDLFTRADALRRLNVASRRIPIVVLASRPSIEQAVEAMRSGAYHYFGKRDDLEHVVELLSDALQPNKPSPSAQLLGDSAAMRRVREMIARIADSPSSTALITGESGTGKSLVARAIHEQSNRRDRPFVTVTCSAIPEALLESELFGHERGAFTGAERHHAGLLQQAEGGTLLLDEIGEMSLAMQARLLGVLETRRFRRVGGSDERQADVRVIAATNVHLQEAIRTGRFREDLYYRLQVVGMHIPPLREHPEDIPPLVRSFVQRLAGEIGIHSPEVPSATLDVLRTHPWPGNVRQLRNAIERALLLMDGGTLMPDDLAEVDDSEGQPDSSAAFVLPVDGLDMEELERALLEQALRRSRGNQRLAGEMLGMNRDQVRYRIAKYGIPRARSG